MKFSSLKSSNIDGVHYDEDAKTLTVRFKSGGEYTYAAVGKKHYDGLMKAESPGSYFGKHIKDAHKWTKAETKK